MKRLWHATRTVAARLRLLMSLCQTLFARVCAAVIALIAGGVALAPHLALAENAPAAGDSLVDKSLELPLALSPDFAETPAPARSRLAADVVATGPIAPAAQQPAGSLSGKIVY